MDADFYGAYLASHDFGNLLVLHFLITAKNEDFALFWRQLEHRALEKRHLLLFFKAASRNGRRTLECVDVVLRQGCFGLMFSVVIESRIAGDVKHPCFESAVTAKRAAVFENAKEDVLNQILCYASAGGHSRKVVKERAMVSVEQESEFGKLAVSHGLHEVFVGFGHSVCKNFRLLRRLPGN